MEQYMTCEEVSSVMSGVRRLEALQCLGRMNEYATYLEEQMALRYRWQGG